MKKLMCVMGVVLASVAATAGAATQADESAIEQYRYGMHLDVAKVMSVKQLDDSCGVVPAVMTYRDHNGNVQQVSYHVVHSCMGE